MENNEKTQKEEKEFLQVFIGASLHFLKSLLLLLLLPFDLWKKAVVRMSEARDSKSFKISNIGGLWPFLSWIKKLVFEFLFDAITYLCYILGPISAIISVIMGISNGGFGTGMTMFFTSLITAYICPVIISLNRDLFQIMLLPISKFFSWCKKPAQQLDIDLTKKN